MEKGKMIKEPQELNICNGTEIAGVTHTICDLPWEKKAIYMYNF